MTIGDKIAQLRKNKLKTQQEMAAELNVSRQKISKWENNLSLPNLEDLYKLSQYFEVPIDVILNSADSNENKIENLYLESQIVFKKVEAEAKKSNIINICLMLICCVSTVFTLVTGYRIKNYNDIYNQISNTSSLSKIMLINQLNEQNFSPYFVGINHGETYMNIDKINLGTRMVQCDFQFTLKEYNEHTQMTIQFDNMTYSLDKTNENTFVFCENIPLRNYDEVTLKINGLKDYIVEFDLGANENCYYLTCCLYNTIGFYLPINYGENLVRLDIINYDSSYFKDIRNTLFSYNYEIGEIQLEIFDDNENRIINELFMLGKKEERVLKEKLPLNQQLKVIVTINIDDQQIILNGILETPKNAEDKVYVTFDKRYMW